MAHLFEMCLEDLTVSLLLVFPVNVQILFLGSYFGHGFVILTD